MGVESCPCNPQIDFQSQVRFSIDLTQCDLTELSDFDFHPCSALFRCLGRYSRCNGPCRTHGAIRAAWDRKQRNVFGFDGLFIVCCSHLPASFSTKLGPSFQLSCFKPHLFANIQNKWFFHPSEFNSRQARILATCHVSRENSRQGAPLGGVWHARPQINLTPCACFSPSFSL